MKTRTSKIFEWYFSKGAAPYWIVLVMDCVFVVLSGMFAYSIIERKPLFPTEVLPLLKLNLVFLPGYLLAFRVFRTYSGILRYSSSYDLMRVALSMLCGALFSFCIHRILIVSPFMMNVRSMVIIMTCAFAVILTMMMRVAVKCLYDGIVLSTSSKPSFVYGILEGGEAIARSIISDKTTNYTLAGFISDDMDMSDRIMMGVKVYHNDENVVEVMKRKNVRTLFVSPLRLPALRQNTELLSRLVKEGIKIMVKSDDIMWDGKSPLSFKTLRKIEIEDLLARDEITIDIDNIAKLLRDNVVLITGAAGSIGSEMVRQVATFKPKHLILVDQAETPTHDIRLYMKNSHPDIPCETIVASIANKSKMESIFKTYKPAYVFHAAAYKHVPMMEDNPSEAVQNNVYGTRVIADLAVKYGTKKFVMVSTDKAVNPTNVMGCSKRICEIYCQSLNDALKELREKGTCDESVRQNLLLENGEVGVTQFVTTRFGNVLGSNGSVIPLFRKQLESGGPLTVTHPDIIRFFMLIPEACKLVLEAGTLGHGGEIMVFDMGEPVRIADLAQRMIDLSGAKDVKIKFTGLRDGEKLYEEVLNDKEDTRPTPHPKIMVSAVRKYPYALALKNEEELYELSFTYDDMAIVKKMKNIVPEYKSQNSKYSALD